MGEMASIADKYITANLSSARTTDNTRMAGENSISEFGIASPDWDCCDDCWPDCWPDCGGGGGGGGGGLIDGEDGDGGAPNTFIAHFSIILSSRTSGILQHFVESCLLI